jgi:Tfp pilus assembly protein PilF
MKRLNVIPMLLCSLLLTSCTLGNLSISKRPVDLEADFDHEEALEEDTESYLMAGIEKLQNQENEAAILELKKATIVDPGSAQAYYYLALAQQRAGRYDDALKNYRSALKYDSKFYEAQFNSAVIYSMQEKYDLAMESFRKAFSLYSEDAELYYNLALCYEQMGNIDKAVAEYRKACRLDPNLVEANLRLAALLERRGMLSEAMSEYEKVLKISPDSELARRKVQEISSRIQAERMRKEKEAAQAEVVEPAREEKVQVERKPAPQKEEVANAEAGPEPSQPEEGRVGKLLRASRASLASIISLPKKIYHSVKGPETPDDQDIPYDEEVRFTKNLRLGLNNKLVTKKDVSFESLGEDNSIASKRAIAQIGYTPRFLNIFTLKDTQVYLNFGSVSMGFDKEIPTSTPVEFEQAMAFAYGAGISSQLYDLADHNVKIYGNLDFLHYAPEIEAEDGGVTYNATADLTEYQLAADAVYKGFSKFSPYLGLLYAKTSGSFELAGLTENLDFNEKNSLGCRIGTAYQWRQNIALSGEYRLMDENALSLLIHYSF